MKLVFFVLSLVSIARGLSYQSPSNEIDSRGSDGKLFNLFFRPERDVNFQLFTRRNPFVGQRIVLGDVVSLFESNFNFSAPTRFLIHGWISDGDSFFMVDGTEAYLTNGDFNVISVDWSRGAQTINYVAARNRVAPVGRVVSHFIEFLHENEALRFADLTVVGFSLGAHIAGIAGKTVQRGRINTIIGLDPAGPLFNIRNPNERIHFTDAEYVEVIHTDTRFTGIGFPIGDADFFPNTGTQQPGCLTNFCNHDRAPLFFIESINSNSFYSHRCKSIADLGRRCLNGEIVTMGGEPSNAEKAVQGIFFLTTNRSSPFAQGRTSNLP